MESRASSVLDATRVPAQGAVDSARPFRSVKEAVAVYGERLLSGNANSKLDLTSRPIPTVFPSPPSYSSPAALSIQDDHVEITALSSLRKLEAEVAAVKQEVVRLKERESDTARTIAALSSQLQKGVSKFAAANAAESQLPSRAQSERWRDRSTRDMEESFEYLPCLGQALGISDLEDKFGRRRRRKIKLQNKQKPIVPLIGDLFSRKKSAFDHNATFYSFS